MNFVSIQDSQSGTERSGGAMIETGAGKPSLTSLEPHHLKLYQRKVVKPTIKLEPNHLGLAIVVPFHSFLSLTNVLTRFAVYEPQDEPSLKSYIQAVDLVELKHHPILVMVYGHGLARGNLLHPSGGFINIKEDIMAPLFPPIASHLADNPKIFLFAASNSKRHALHFVEAIWENCIVGYIACDDLGDMRWVRHIVRGKLAHPSMSVQEIFTSISDQLLPFATMTVLDRLKKPVYLYPRGSELMEIHSRLPKRARVSSTPPTFSHPHGSELMKTHGRLGSRPHFPTHSRTFNRSRSQGIVTCL